MLASLKEIVMDIVDDKKNNGNAAIKKNFIISSAIELL
jgi:hypothetical protein